MVDNAK
jgi:hypothetical protein